MIEIPGAAAKQAAIRLSVVAPQRHPPRNPKASEAVYGLRPGRSVTYGLPWAKLHSCHDRRQL